jgi:hypothetical protein
MPEYRDGGGLPHHFPIHALILRTERDSDWPDFQLAPTFMRASRLLAVTKPNDLTSSHIASIFCVGAR